MKKQSFYLVVVMLFSISMVFTSCSKEEAIEQANNTPEQSLDLKLGEKTTKNIEIFSPNRKSKAIVTIHAEEEAALKEFSAANFTLAPIYEISDENTIYEENTNTLQKPELQERKFVYEVKIFEEDPEALGYKVDVNMENASRYYSYLGYLYTSYDCARVSTHFGKNLVYYWDSYCSGCAHYYSFGAETPAGWYSSSCRSSRTKIVDIYWETAYGGYSVSWSLYN